jgi:outer membrane protein assembly factor BamB
MHAVFIPVFYTRSTIVINMCFRGAGLLAVLAGLFILLCVPASQAASMEIIQKGVSGSITSGIGLDSLSGAGEQIFFGTQLGAYVFSASSGALVNFIQTGGSVTNVKGVPDINGNGHGEVVLTTSDAYFPNVLCFDSSTGDKLWEFSSETEVFDMEMMWTMKQVSAYGLEASESGDRVYLTAGYNVYCLDSSTGERLWSYEGTDNMWDLVLVDGDVVAGDQNGYIYRLDGSGGLVWSTLASQPYTVVNPSTRQEMGTVKRSVWDIVPLGGEGSTMLAAACEDGYLRVLDFGTGEILQSAEIIDYADELLYSYYGDYPVPTSFMDYNFFNMRAAGLPDVNGDGSPDVLVYTYPGMRTGKQYQGAQAGIYVVDPTDGEIITKNENLGLATVNRLGSVFVRVLGDKTFILLPLGMSGSVEKVRVISPEDCSTVKTISINSSAGSWGVNRYVTADLGGSDFLLASDQGDLIRSDFKGNVEWSYPRLSSIRIEKADLVGSARDDLLVLSQEGLQDDFLDEGTTRTIFVINGETREMAWSYEMPFDEFVETGGLQQVRVVADLNMDGKQDVAAYKQRYTQQDREDEFGNHTRIVVFSGNGEILWEKPITNYTHYGVYDRIYRYPPFVENLLAMQWGYGEESTIYSVDVDQRGEFQKQLMELEDRLEEQEEERRIRKIITSLDTVSDVGGDGLPDFVVGSRNDILIIDSVTGKTLWNRTYRHWLYEDPFGNNPMAGIVWNWSEHEEYRYFSLGDTSGDGYDELLQVSWDGLRILRSTGTGLKTLDYGPLMGISPEGGNIDRERVKVIQDINGDGFRDIIFEMHREDSPSVYRIVRGNDGTEIMDLEREGTSVSLSVSDLNSDGFSESMVFYAHGQSGPRFEVMSGRSRDVMWSYQEYEETWMLREMFGISDIMPACTIEDLDGDGSEELVLGRSLPWDTGADLLVYNVKEDVLLSKVSIESQDPMSGFEEKRWQPAIVTARLSDLTGDGVSEIATVMALGEGDRKQLKLVIVDMVEGEIISDFTARGTEIEGLGDEIVTYGTGGELYLLKPGRDVSITSPLDGDTVTSPMGIAWESGDGESVKIVMVDNRKIMKTSGEGAEFDIREGARKVTLYSFDRHGKGVYDTIDVVVEKGSASAPTLTALVILLLAVLFLPRLLPRVLREGIAGLMPRGIGRPSGGARPQAKSSGAKALIPEREAER